MLSPAEREQAAQARVVGSSELLAEQKAEVGVAIAVDFFELRAVHLPVFGLVAES